MDRMNRIEIKNFKSAFLSFLILCILSIHVNSFLLFSALPLKHHDS